MKRATFVFTVLLIITATVILTKNEMKNESASIVKVDLKKQHLSGLYN